MSIIYRRKSSVIDRSLSWENQYQVTNKNYELGIILITQFSFLRIYNQQDIQQTTDTYVVV